MITLEAERLNFSYTWRTLLSRRVLVRSKDVQVAGLLISSTGRYGLSSCRCISLITQLCDIDLRLFDWICDDDVGCRYVGQSPIISNSQLYRIDAGFCVFVSNLLNGSSFTIIEFPGVDYRSHSLLPMITIRKQQHLYHFFRRHYPPTSSNNPPTRTTMRGDQCTLLCPCHSNI